MPATWGPAKCGDEIQRIRSAFKWAVESEVIPGPSKFGPALRKPTMRVVRRAKQQRRSEHGTLAFSVGELRALLHGFTSWLKACISLGIYGGVGASDCGRHKDHHLDADTGAYDLARERTRAEIQEAKTDRFLGVEL